MTGEAEVLLRHGKGLRAGRLRLRELGQIVRSLAPSLRSLSSVAPTEDAPLYCVSGCHGIIGEGTTPCCRVTLQSFGEPRDTHLPFGLAHVIHCRAPRVDHIPGHTAGHANANAPDPLTLIRSEKTNSKLR